MSLPLPLMEQLAHALPQYIANRRWFRAKTKNISHVEIPYVIPAGSFLILILRVHYLLGVSDLYLLPVTSVNSPRGDEISEQPITTFESPDGQPVAVFDAVSYPFFRTLLFRALTESTTFPSHGGSLVAKSSITVTPPEGVMESTVSRAEQSNTSIIFGREFILKLFRKLEAGINPDIEIGAFLTSHGFKNTPAVLASVEFQADNGDNFSAGILQQFVPNLGDAWRYTLQSLESYYQRALEASPDTPQFLGDYAASATLLGMRTAQMHAALASCTTNSDFTPEPFTADDARSLSLEITTQVKDSLQLLKFKIPALCEADQLLAGRVVDLERHLLRQLHALGSLATDAQRIRVHGDYHLGQVLYTGSDFMIIDFEGEPARPLIERRAKGLALRDVAGMLRSFQYAAYAALPSHSALTEKLAQSSAFWYTQATKLYLDAYFTEAASKPFLPSTYEQRRTLLDALLLQKALYEVQYELNNRPGWISIPLRGILSLTEY